MDRRDKPFGQIIDDQKEGERVKDEFCDAARIDREKNGMTSNHRFYLSVIRWSVLFGIIAMFFLFRSCGGTLM